MRGAGRLCAAILSVGVATVPGFAHGDASTEMADYKVVDGTIPAPLLGLPGNAVRGRAIVLDRAVGNCLICHKVPVGSEPFQGELGPDLTGVGGRLSAAQIRMTLVDQSRLNADTLMPPYHRVGGLRRVGKEWQRRPALSAQQIEDVVAWLVSLR